MGALQWAVDTADELLRENGKPMTFYREVEDSPADPDKPWRPDGLLPDPPEEFDVIAMTVDYNERHVDGTVIRNGDVNCFLAAKDLTYVPHVGDYAIIEGQKWKIINPKLLAPGVDRILYEIQMRA